MLVLQTPCPASSLPHSQTVPGLTAQRRRRRRRLKSESSEMDPAGPAGAAPKIQVSLGPGPFLADMKAKARVAAEGSPAGQKFPGEARRCRISPESAKPRWEAASGVPWPRSAWEPEPEAPGGAWIPLLGGGSQPCSHLQLPQHPNWFNTCELAKGECERPEGFRDPYRVSAGSIHGSFPAFLIFCQNERLRWTGQVVERADLRTSPVFSPLPGRVARVTCSGRSHLDPVSGTPLSDSPSWSLTTWCMQHHWAPARAESARTRSVWGLPADCYLCKSFPVSWALGFSDIWGF